MSRAICPVILTSLIYVRSDMYGYSHLTLKSEVTITTLYYYPKPVNLVVLVLSYQRLP